MKHKRSGASSAPQSADRQHARLPKAYNVEAWELSFTAAGSGPAIRGTINNISKSGICLESSRPLAVDLAMQVRIHIPMLNKFSSSFFKVYENDAEQFLIAIAKTVWCKPSGGKYLIGMNFVNVDETQANALAALISKAIHKGL